MSDHTPSDDAPFAPLDRVVDSHSDDPSPSRAVVLGCLTDSTIAAETVDPAGKAVADFAANAEYPPDDIPVQVVFEESLDWEFGDRWRRWDFDTLWDHAQRPQFPVVYSYPSQRLQKVEAGDE